MNLAGQKPSSCSPPKRWFLDWQFDHYQRDLHRHLLDNCDLPPPLKFTSPIQPEDDDPKKLTITPITTQKGIKDGGEELGLGSGSNQGEGENPSLRRALQLSQTRAREAEKKATTLERRSEEITNLMLEESMRLFAYRQWMKLLEVEMSLLKTEAKRSSPLEMRKEDSMAASAAPSPWWVALAVCVGIAGVGLALGRFMF